MKVDFNQIKTTISLPDFLLELGWKIVEGSSNSCPKMSNGTLISHFLTFAGGMASGVMLMCLMQTGKLADKEFETMKEE